MGLGSRREDLYTMGEEQAERKKAD